MAGRVDKKLPKGHVVISDDGYRNFPGMGNNLKSSLRKITRWACSDFLF